MASSSTSSAGQLKTLSGSRIRLIDIDPASSINDPLRCRYSTVSLQDNPAYEALSYVWGASEGAYYVSVDGRETPVTDNLHAALQHLRLPDRARTLWVDTLCIAQEYMTEKMHQVARMGDIFSQATQVVVWLDAGWDGRDDAMQFVRTIAGDTTVHLDPEQQPHAEVDGQKIDSPQLRKNIMRLFSLPWWTRTWTIQEFVLARELTFVCGSAQVSRHTMYMARETFWAHKDHCCTSPLLTARDPTTGLSLLGAFEVPARLDHISKSRQRDFSVLTPIATFCKRNATNPRDRVYGMLGLGTGSYANLVAPDYTLSPEQVCHATALQSVTRTGKLEFLSHLFEHDNAKLPLFVPNWTGSFQWFDIYSLWIGNVPGFRAAGDTNAEFQMDESTLCAKGVVVDTIEDTCNGCVIERLRDAHYADEMLGIALPDGLYEAAYPSTNESKLLAFWHTLNGGMEQVLRDSNRYHRRLRGSTDLTRCYAFLRFAVAQGRKALWNTEMEAILLDVESGTRRRRFFRTQHGYFGMGPRKTESGDKVIVLLGGNMPYIVRDAPAQQPQGSFTILGDAYIHGFMDGEALASVENGDREFQEIIVV